MIRYKDQILEDYFIDPVTAKITDKNGNEQFIKMHQGRPEFNGMKVQCIQAHTHLGYFEGCNVHHIDENPLNNSLSNLVVLTRAEHMHLHKKGKGQTTDHPWWHKGELETCSKECPGEGWIKGRAPVSKEIGEKISAALKGRNFSEEHKAKLSASMKGKNKGRVKWVKEGEANYKLSKECPGEGWVKCHK